MKARDVRLSALRLRDNVRKLSYLRPSQNRFFHIWDCGRSEPAFRFFRDFRSVHPWFLYPASGISACGNTQSAVPVRKSKNSLRQESHIHGHYAVHVRRILLCVSRMFGKIPGIFHPCTSCIHDFQAHNTPGIPVQECPETYGQLQAYLHRYAQPCLPRSVQHPDSDCGQHPAADSYLLRKRFHAGLRSAQNARLSDYRFWGYEFRIA